MNRKQTTKATAAAKSRTVYVPKGSTAYIVTPGAPLPDALEKAMNLRAESLATQIVLAEKEKASMKAVNQRIPTSDEVASDVLKMLADHSEGEKNKIIAILLHRRENQLKDRIREQQHTCNVGRDILQELQEADNQLNAITLGNFTMI